MCIKEKRYTLLVCAVLFWIVNGNNTQVRQDVAEETQHAVCNISTKDVQTSANASVTRQLKGVCTSKQMDYRFEQLELKVIKEFRSIKKILSRVHGENFFDADDLDTNINPQYSDDTYSARTWEENEVIEETKPIFLSFKTIRTNYKNEEIEKPIFNVEVQQTKSENMEGTNFNGGTNRTNNFSNLNRIKLLNNTVQREAGHNIYYYFWKIENFNRMMKKVDIYLTSPSFMVLGHDLTIQIHPNQPDKNYLSLKLRASSSFVKKHTFSILKRTSTGENINSILLGMDPRDSEKFSVTLRSIKNSECLKEDSIIIELNILL